MRHERKYSRKENLNSWSNSFCSCFHCSGRDPIFKSVIISFRGHSTTICEIFSLFSLMIVNPFIYTHMLLFIYCVFTNCYCFDCLLFTQHFYFSYFFIFFCIYLCIRATDMYNVAQVWWTNVKTKTRTHKLESRE